MARIEAQFGAPGPYSCKGDVTGCHQRVFGPNFPEASKKSVRTALRATRLKFASCGYTSQCSGHDTE